MAAGADAETIRQRARVELTMDEPSSSADAEARRTDAARRAAAWSAGKEERRVAKLHVATRAAALASGRCCTLPQRLRVERTVEFDLAAYPFPALILALLADDDANNGDVVDDDGDAMATTTQRSSPLPSAAAGGTADGDSDSDSDATTARRSSSLPPAAARAADGDGDGVPTTTAPRSTSPPPTEAAAAEAAAAEAAAAEAAAASALELERLHEIAAAREWLLAALANGARPYALRRNVFDVRFKAACSGDNARGDGGFRRVGAALETVYRRFVRDVIAPLIGDPAGLLYQVVVPVVRVGGDQTGRSYGTVLLAVVL